MGRIAIYIYNSWNFGEVLTLERVLTWRHAWLPIFSYIIFFKHPIGTMRPVVRVPQKIHKTRTTFVCISFTIAFRTSLSGTIFISFARATKFEVFIPTIITTSYKVVANPQVKSYCLNKCLWKEVVIFIIDLLIGTIHVISMHKPIDLCPIV